MSVIYFSSTNNITSNYQNKIEWLFEVHLFSGTSGSCSWSQEQDLSNVVFKHYAMQTFYVGTFPCKIVNDYFKKISYFVGNFIVMFVRQKHKTTLSNLKKKKRLNRKKKNTCKNMLNKELSFNYFCREIFFFFDFFSLSKKKLENNY